LPVAAHFGLGSATVLACWFPAYDPEFAKYSPGLVLHLRMAEAAAAEGVGLLDMGRGPAEYKDSLKTGELAVYEGAVTRPGTGAALHWLSREPVRRAYGFVRARPRLASLASRTLKGAGRLRRPRGRGGGRMSRRARTAQEENRRFLASGARQVAEVDLHGDEAGLRPGPGSAPVTHGEVFGLVRRDGRPAGTLRGHGPPGGDPGPGLARLA